MPQRCSGLFLGPAFPKLKRLVNNHCAYSARQLAAVAMDHSLRE
jgi:hypothetical protein